MSGCCRPDGYARPAAGFLPLQDGASTFQLDARLDIRLSPRESTRARKVYAERHRAVWSTLTRHAGPLFTPLPTQAGLHLALLTPAAPDDDELAARAARRQLRLSRLRLSYQFSEPRAGIVVGFGAIATPDVPRAISMLRECVE